MTRTVERDQIVDYETYRERRSDERSRMQAVKGARRIHLGEHLTFLFENVDTMRYQVQEMMLAERIVKEEAIRHEIDTYNQLLGGPGELGCSLLIEIDDPAERKEKLSAWVGLPERIYLELEDGTRVPARFDPAQVGEDRLSSVQYLKFDVGGRTPVAIGCDSPLYPERAELTGEQRAALAEDLAS